MTTPRRIAGRADLVRGSLAKMDPGLTWDGASRVAIARQAEAARRPARPLLAPEPAEEPSPPGPG